MKPRSPERILIVNTSDAGGGAERISMALLDGFQALGTEARMAVATKRTSDPRIVSFYQSPHVDYTREHPLRRARLRLRRSLDRRLGIEDFNHPYTRHVAELAGGRPDVLLCNNLHGGYFDLRQLPWLSLRIPLVLRLADSWLFTGHCAVPGSCARWRTGCGSCPDLAAPPAIGRDATRLNWQRKRWIFARSRLSLVAPSRWMLDRAQRSLMASAIGEARVIPNGVDLETFSPDGPRAARSADTPRLVFAANGGSANPHKDFASLRMAVQRIGGPIELVSVGGKSAIEELGGGVRIRHEPYQGPEQLAALYRSADAHAHAAAEESFCLSAAEALACGTPVVAASGGAIGEVVDHERTGLLVSPGDVEGLSAALRRLLGRPEIRLQMSANARSARRRFDRDRMVRDIHALCADALAVWPGSIPPPA
jgi:glycosyltransferase involved in cell wall biosynthesis